MDRDKLFVIVCVTIIYGLTAWLDRQNANTIVFPIITGIFAITTGSQPKG